MALYENHVKYGQGHLFPGLAKAATQFRRAVLRQRPTAVTGQARLSAGASLTLGWGVVQTPIDTSMPVERQLSLLVERLKSVEGRLTRQATDIDAHRADLDSLRAASERADREIETLTKEVAAGTVGLQIKGLILVGIGSVLLAIPTVLV